MQQSWVYIGKVFPPFVLFTCKFYYNKYFCTLHFCHLFYHRNFVLHSLCCPVYIVVWIYARLWNLHLPQEMWASRKVHLTLKWLLLTTVLIFMKCAAADVWNSMLRFTLKQKHCASYWWVLYIKRSFLGVFNS